MDIQKDDTKATTVFSNESMELSNTLEEEKSIVTPQKVAQPSGSKSVAIHANRMNDPV